MMQSKLLVLILGLVITGSATAQWNNQRCKKVSVSDTITLDSLTIVEETIMFAPNASYDYTLINNKIVFNQKPKQDTLEICYRVLPINLSQEQYKRSTDELDSTGVVFQSYLPEEKEELFSTPGMEKSGVISRGISFGNSQDVFVNSNLNLQMKGTLSNDVELIATISDQNIPIQPEGNTQQIQEFDRIMMQLKHSRWQLDAGDIWLKNPDDTYFMRYNKRVQGGNFTMNLFQDSAYYSNTHIGASLARGKFFSYALPPIEGVQGPYRLVGSNGEKFIVVIANSERVFLDGKPLSRGFNNDYIIDYNTAEIIFNNSVVITKFSRIRIDFEYTERNFTRSVISAGHEQKINNVDLYYEYFTERDHPRQPIFTELSDGDYSVLRAIGDSLNQAYVNGSMFSDSASLVKYKQLVVLGDTIYEYSTDPDSALYIVNFSEVGQGRGDYVIDQTPVNGRIYKYVGKGIGDYLPIRFLPVPNKREMMVTGSRWHMDENTVIFSEFSLSNKDVNLVSSNGNADNQGIGIRTGIERNKKKINERYYYNTLLEYQYTSETFNPLDRFRDVDFQRDWNEDMVKQANDNMIFSMFSLNSKKGDFYTIENNLRNKEGDVNGFQNKVSWKQGIGNLKFSGLTFVMDNQRSDRTAQWRKISLHPSYTIGQIKPGYSLNIEKNRVTNGQDSVMSTQMNYEEHNMYVENNDTSSTKFKLNYQTRKDFLPINGQLDWFDGFNSSQWNDLAHTYNAELDRRFSPSQSVALVGTYRELNTRILQDSTAFENNFLSRVDWSSDYFKRHISSELTYTVNTARELRREVQYVQWDNYATATHVWKDNNGNGTQDLDEFFPIINNETQNTYIRISVPTSDYIPAFTNSLNYRFNVRGPLSWKSKKGIRNFISRFDNLSVINTERKTINDDFNSRLNPFIGFLDTLNLVSQEVLSVQRSIRSTLFFNKSNPKYGFSLTRLNLGTRQLVTSGSDARLADRWEFNARSNITRHLSTNTIASIAEDVSRSTYLQTRNYVIRTPAVKEQFSIQPNTSLRFTLNYDYSVKQGNSQTETAVAQIQKAGLETKVNQLSKRTITAAFHYIRINYTGQQNTSMGYEIMEALQNGDNFTWEINIQQRLSNGLNINLVYEGRKSENNSAIHTGRMQVSALF